MQNCYCCLPAGREVKRLPERYLQVSCQGRTHDYWKGKEEKKGGRNYLEMEEIQLMIVSNIMGYMSREGENRIEILGIIFCTPALHAKSEKCLLIPKNLYESVYGGLDYCHFYNCNGE